jgi:hypothetical protein
LINFDLVANGRGSDGKTGRQSRCGATVVTIDFAYFLVQKKVDVTSTSWIARTVTAVTDTKPIAGLVEAGVCEDG